jgi:excinuclease ABC subunit A
LRESPIYKNQHDSGSTTIKRWAKEFMDEIPCPFVNSRLKKLNSKIDEQNITELCAMDISDLPHGLRI